MTVRAVMVRAALEQKKILPTGLTPFVDWQHDHGLAVVPGRHAGTTCLLHEKV